MSHLRTRAATVTPPVASQLLSLKMILFFPCRGISGRSTIKRITPSGKQGVPVFEKLFAQEECNERNGREKRANIHQEAAVLVATLAKECQITIKCGW
jgi:hypothetical protein